MGDGGGSSPSAPPGRPRPGPTLTLYSMAKCALGGLTKGLARDLGPGGIRVTLVQAGPIDTDLNPENGPAADFIRSITALGHYGRAEDVAAWSPTSQRGRPLPHRHRDHHRRRTRRLMLRKEGSTACGRGPPAAETQAEAGSSRPASVVPQVVCQYTE